MMAPFYLVDGVELQMEDLVNSLTQAEHVCDDAMIKQPEATTAAGAPAAASEAFPPGGGGETLPPHCGCLSDNGVDAQRSRWESRWRTCPRQSSQTIPNKYHSSAMDNEKHKVALGSHGVPRSRRPWSADGKRRNHGPRWGQAPGHRSHERHAACFARRQQLLEWSGATPGVHVCGTGYH